MDSQDVLAVLRGQGYPPDMRGSQADVLMARYGVTKWRAGRNQAHRVLLTDLAQALCEALNHQESSEPCLTPPEATASA